MKAKFSLKKLQADYLRESSSLLQEVQELHAMVNERKAHNAVMEGKLDEARQQRQSVERELKDAIDRASSAEENAHFLKVECESRRKETVVRIREEFEERINAIEAEHKVRPNLSATIFNLQLTRRRLASPIYFRRKQFHLWRTITRRRARG